MPAATLTAAKSAKQGAATASTDLGSTTTSICGHMTAHWNESTTRFMSSVANERSGKPVRPPPSSTARA